MPATKKTNPRPYFSLSVKELVELFEKDPVSIKTLKQLKKELEHRSTPKAKELEKKVVKRLDALQGGNQPLHDVEESDQYSLFAPSAKYRPSIEPPLTPVSVQVHEEEPRRIAALEQELQRRNEEVKRLQEEVEKQNQPLVVRAVETIKSLLGKNHGK